ncbi:RNA methyltransferase [Pedobacter sp. HMF7647]|uniref:RNA methyltransferase n=1 Tax=Hufsiella arboris TaxID=2695275 RepID=A0A7K1YBE8_9SPHI|nr:RNA methyltransferase [Hufsiella arboris]MXV51914.1 RNA methyltransferase [Hufsiella arboris]
MGNKLPNELLQSLIKDFNIEQELFEQVHNDENQITSIRLNTKKPFNIFRGSKNIPWCDTGFYLNDRPAFIADPDFHAGCYYVQEASSMFLEQALKHSTNLADPLRVLDLCAAPGGKSTHILSLISEDSLLVSNEIIKTRVGTLADNITKWGSSNAFVTNNDPKDFSKLEGFFDVMVIDAPCSGSGMFRKDPETVSQWSEGNVQLCSQRQQRILANALPALKEDGVLIYSTCSYSKEENENIADWLIDEFTLESIQIPLKSEWNILETTSEIHSAYGYRFYPHLLSGEGFFLTCFRKKKQSGELKYPKQKPVIAGKKEAAILKEWLQSPDRFSFIQSGDDYLAIRNEHIDDFNLIKSKLYLKKAGIRLGAIQGKNLVPDHELAMSQVNNHSIQRLELSRDEALRYMRKDDLKVETDLTGWVLMCFGSHPLGWAKILPNRINNYYPKNLRILKSLQELN